MHELAGLSGDDTMHATIRSFLGGPSVSNWLRGAVVEASRRDPVQAVNEAEMLFSIVNSRCEAITRQAGRLGRALSFWLSRHFFGPS